MMNLFRNENDYADLNVAAAVEHLCRAIQFPTVGYVDTEKIDYSAFDAMHAYLQASFPHVAKYGTWEKLGHSLLITLPGSGPELKPALFMAHQDVVPVIAGTEKDWLHGPFSGDVADGYIWGRGAIDIKDMLVAELESAEYLLKSGCTFNRTVYLAFGEDEETCSTGVRAIASLLKDRGVTLEFVLDEGTPHVADAVDWGAPGVLTCPIGMYEKGYGDMKLQVRSRGGHSSNPFHGTSLGQLAEAISKVIQNPPEPHLSASIISSLHALLPLITEEPMRTWAQDPEAHETELLAWFCKHESLYHLVQTTIAPTMISGGAPVGNVMPQDMEANINFRMIPADSPESLLQKYRELLGDHVEVSWAQEIGASVPSEIESYGFNMLKSILEYYFADLIYIPQQNRGATDARWYEEICRCVMRFAPFMEDDAIITEGMHGTNERLSVRAYLQGIRVLITMMKQTCIKGE